MGDEIPLAVAVGELSNVVWQAVAMRGQVMSFGRRLLLQGWVMLLLRRWRRGPRRE